MLCRLEECCVDLSAKRLATHARVMFIDSWRLPAGAYVGTHFRFAVSTQEPSLTVAMPFAVLEFTRVRIAVWPRPISLSINFTISEHALKLTTISEDEFAMSVPLAVLPFPVVPVPTPQSTSRLNTHVGVYWWEKREKNKTLHCQVETHGLFVKNRRQVAWIDMSR